jgi:hypothetical protein
MTTDLSKLMTVAAAQRRTTLAEPTLRARLRDASLKETRLAGAIFAHEDALEEYLRRHPEHRA